MTKTPLNDWTRLHELPLDWAAIETAIPFAAEMRECVQDTVFHAEGDVWTHTRMVVEELVASDSFAALPEPRKAGVFLAALFHDIAKPLTYDQYHDPDLGRLRVSDLPHLPKSTSELDSTDRPMWHSIISASIRS